MVLRSLETGPLIMTVGIRSALYICGVEVRSHRPPGPFSQGLITNEDWNLRESEN